MEPNEKGEFDYVIGSNARNDSRVATLNAADLNTSRPVFVELALMAPNQPVRVLLPRQRLVSVGFALQAGDAAVDERLVHIEGDIMTGPLEVRSSLSVGSGGPSMGTGDAFVAGTLQVGASSLRLNGSGVRFPDGTTQTTAGLASVMHDGTLQGTGSSGMPLGIAPGGVDTNQLANGAVTSPKIATGGVDTNQLANGAVTSPKIASGQVVKSLNGLFDNVNLVGAGPNITITPSGNMLTIAAPNALSSVAHNATLTGNGTSGIPLGVAVPLSLSGSVLLNPIITGTNSGLGDGVRGETTSGFAGVRGKSANINGTGVFGENTSSGDGVFGESTSGFGVEGRSSGAGTGVRGTSSGNGTGVEGISTSGAGVVGRSSGAGTGVFASSSSGDLFEGQSGAFLRFQVTNGGDVKAHGTFMNNSLDFAEMTEVEESGRQEDGPYQPGDVLIISDETGKLKKCSQPYCSLVAGIYSTNPGFLGGQGIEESSANKVPLALIGQVPCKVTTENGPIRIGDLLVTSSRPGHAMKGTDRSQMLGAIVGKALEPLPSGTGIIRVLVTLQ